MSSQSIDSARQRFWQGVGLLWLRVSASVLVIQVHGLPKLLHYTEQLRVIEDPFHLGANVTLCLAIFAEVLCPLLVIAGVLVRLACLPVLVVLLIALVAVHPEWTLEQGQFAWWLTIIFSTLLITGPGALAPRLRWPLLLRYA